MRIRLVAVGQKLPEWVESGYREYARRLPRECRIELVEIPVATRSRNADTARAIQEEGRRMLAAVPEGARVVALDVRGRMWSTEALATRLQDWMQEGRMLCLLVGGPDGLAPACLERAELRWSLSALTFPHALVRVLLAEQLYRACSLLRGHPYHRA